MGGRGEEGAVKGNGLAIVSSKFWLPPSPQEHGGKDAYLTGSPGG